jgi:hypothetical protein
MKPTVAITGFTGSIGSALLKGFEEAKWETIPWDPRLSNYTPKKVDCLVLAHGGHGVDGLKTFEKNTFVTSLILKNFLSFLNKDGCVILISSRRALRPTVAEWHYAAAKAAAHAYLQSLYQEFPRTRFTAICPGWVESRWAKDEQAEKTIPVKELCDLVVLVASSKGMRIPEIFIEPIGDAQF